MPDFGTSRHGRCLFKLKILKEVLATYAQTLRETLFPNMTPWPGRNSCYRSDAGRDARDSIKRPASHTTLDGSMFIAWGGEGLQGGGYEVESGRGCHLA